MARDRRQFLAAATFSVAALSPAGAALGAAGQAQPKEEEDRLFGKGGFRQTVDQVAAIEKQLGIDDLARFTPRLPAD